MPRWLAIGLVSLAGLLLEVGYTRIVSYKLWYYYTYLVIGLALLGIGSGGVFVAVFSPVRRWSTGRILAACSVWGALSIAAGYLVVANLRVDTVAIWDYGTGRSFANLARLGLICFAIFATFIAFGIIVAVLLGRAGQGVGRMYFSDLVGAGLGCLLAIPLISRLGPPRVIMLAALVFAAVGIVEASPRSMLFVLAGATSAVLVVSVVSTTFLPDVYTEARKEHAPVSEHSEWGPVFRVDVVKPPGSDGNDLLLLHDGTFGSGMHRFDGNVDALKAKYENEPRSIPFAVLDRPPARELIIGSAGGNEILASLAYRAPNIEAVELNPVTTGLLTTDDRFADFTGRLAERPDVHLHQGDGRSYLARRDTRYDLIWYVAPDSYAATNAASSGAFVLSESYLYTAEMIEETLEHLHDDGIMVVQFGELSFDTAPNRTSRYVVTARAALEAFGVDDPSRHIMVAAHVPEGLGDLSTIVVKRTPFTDAEIERFLLSVGTLPDHRAVAAPGQGIDSGVVSRLAAGSGEEVDAIVASSDKDISAVTDDAPYFWHFSRFGDVIGDIGTSLDVTNPEDVIGERVLLLLLGMAMVYAAVFLLAPFLAVRRKWHALPAKGTSAVYFAALGLGFMFFEITMIQRLVLFLGYPTYSLTVTLAAILVSTGLGALASRRVADRPNAAIPMLLGVLAVLTAFYLFALPGILNGPMLSTALGVRVAFAIVVLTPLGLCLGMFMPLGLGRVVALTIHGEEYVAWAWAVNGFFSVIGSVLTTILSMALGFRVVQLAAFAVYAVAALAFTRLPSPLHRGAVALDDGTAVAAATV
jgi:spermidine synthase